MYINITYFDYGGIIVDFDKKAAIIAKYINDSRHSQSVMINGEWGVGKTFFVEKKLLALDELKDYTIIKYSLYGVQSYEQVNSELQKRILLKMIEKKEFKIKNKKIKMPKKLLNFAPNAIDIILNRFGFKPNDLDDIINKFDFNKAKLLIIFDDLERVGMDINEVLGIINSYVEEKQIKVIIIANENEIGSSRVSTNLPQKFAVASNPIISLEIDKKESSATISNKNSKQSNSTSYNYNALIERTKTLFSNDIIYKSIKEKLIGLTVTIHADFHGLYEKLVDEYTKETQSNIILKDNKDAVLTILQETNCQNLRTFIFAIVTFDDIYMIIDNNIHKNKDANQHDRYNNLLNKEYINILKYVFYTSIMYKSGKLDDQKSDNSLSSYMDYLIRGINKYSFVNKYVFSHEIDETKVINEIDAVIKEMIDYQEEENKKDTLAFYKINSYGWLDYTDNEVVNLFDQLYNELLDEKYDIRFFKDIISSLLHIDYNFDKKDKLKHTYNEYITLMEKYIEQHDLKEHQLDLLEITTFDNEFKKKYDDFVQPLLSATRRKEICSTNDGIKEIFDSEQWGEEFYKYCRDNRSYFIDNRHFLSLFDISIIQKHLEESSNSEIREFSMAICSVYDFNNIRDFFKSDINNLKAIIDKLDIICNDENTNCTTKLVIDMYLSKLKDKLSLLEK